MRERERERKRESTRERARARARARESESEGKSKSERDLASAVVASDTQPLFIEERSPARLVVENQHGENH